MRRLAIILILILSVPGWAAQVIRYVDTAATDVIPGTVNDGTDWTNAYQSLNEWEANEQTNLDTANNYMTVYLRASGGTADVNACDIFGWTTSATDYIEIIQDDTPTDGVFDATKYRIAAAGTMLYLRVDFIYLRGVQLHMVRTGTQEGRAIDCSGQNASATVHIDSCIIKCESTTTGEQVGIWTGADAASYIIYNTTVYGVQNGANANHYGVWAAVGICYVHNCTIYDCYRGVYDQIGWVSVIGSVIGDCVDDILNGNYVYNNCTNDNDGTNPQIPLSQDWDNELADANNGDFHIVAGGNCIGNGVDDPYNLGVFSDDIRGVARTSTWDIGAYEVGDDPGGSGGVINEWWWRRRHSN